MEREYSSLVLLMVLQVLVKQKKIDPAKFIKDYKAEIQKFTTTFRDPQENQPSDKALEYFADLIEHNLPIKYEQEEAPA